MDTNTPRAIHVIVYEYKGKREITVTKECTGAEALDIFHKEFNTFGSFKLVRVYIPDAAELEMLRANNYL